MWKIKFYRVAGWVLVIYGIIGYLAGIVSVIEFRRIAGLPPLELLAALYAGLLVLALNIFLWIGLILLWRMDRNATPGKKSIWGEFIKIYLVFELVMLLWTILKNGK